MPTRDPEKNRQYFSHSAVFQPLTSHPPSLPLNLSETFSLPPSISPSDSLPPSLPPSLLPLPPPTSLGPPLSMTTV